MNDVVATSSTLGRMIELAWAVGGEDLGTVPCDGMICSTPSGSTAYNLSNGGPVLVRGLDALAVTFIAPHSLHARPLVVPRGLDVTVANRTRRRPVRRPRRRPPRRRDRARAARSRSTSARSGACSRRCRRRRSSGATARPSPPSDAARPDVARGAFFHVGCPLYDDAVLRRLRIENLVLIREAELELAPGPERDHGRDRRRQDDPRAGGRPPARRRRATTSFVGPAGEEAYVEAELDAAGRARRARASCGRRTRTRSSSRGASSATGARARTPGAARPPARTSPPRSSA